MSNVTTGQLLSLADARVALAAIFRGEESPLGYAVEVTGEDPDDA